MSTRRLPSTSTPITPVSGISDFLATSTNLRICLSFPENGIHSLRCRPDTTTVIPLVRIQSTVRHHGPPLDIKGRQRFIGVEARRRSFTRRAQDHQNCLNELGQLLENGLVANRPVSPLRPCRNRPADDCK